MATILSQTRTERSSHSVQHSSNSKSISTKHSLQSAEKQKMYRTKYTSHFVPISPDFLSPLPLSSIHNICVKKVEFESTELKEYKDHYAVIIDGVLSHDECDDLLRYAEMSAGGHGNGGGVDGSTFIQLGENIRGKDESQEEEEQNNDVRHSNGWHRALVRAGANREMLSLKHRNSDRIVWNCQDIATRIWNRVQQVESVAEDLATLGGEKSRAVIGDRAVARGERWKVSERCMNESLKFLRYGSGQYFREHCDGTYETADGNERSFYTIHLYLNDSTASSNSLSPREDILKSQEIDQPPFPPTSDPSSEHLVGGATTFHSRDMRSKLDVDCKAGRVLIFQQKGLLHSGDEVVRGIKYTMRSDIMYEFDEGGAEGECNDERDVVFG